MRRLRRLGCERDAEFAHPIAQHVKLGEQERDGRVVARTYGLPELDRQLLHVLQFDIGRGPQGIGSLDARVRLKRAVEPKERSDIIWMIATL